MSLGYRRPEDMKVVFLGDTAELYAYVEPATEVEVDPDSIVSVDFTISKPDESVETEVGEVLEDGSGFARYANTDQVGSYAVVAKFEFDSGEIRSTHYTFEVQDPLNPPEPTRRETIADAVWLLLEDCFDSEYGGPWLRDMTLRYFDKRKIPALIDDALMEINMTPPMTTLTIIDFTTPVVTGNLDIDGPDPDMTIIAQGTLLATIRHLMRSYVEQPAPQGANVVYEDRRDYLQRWQIIYDIELERYTRWLALWKRQFLGLGKSAVLISSKAGRLYGPGMRTRNVGRGWY